MSFKFTRLRAVDDDMHMNVALKSIVSQFGQPCVHQVLALNFVMGEWINNQWLVDGSQINVLGRKLK